MRRVLSFRWSSTVATGIVIVLCAFTDVGAVAGRTPQTQSPSSGCPCTDPKLCDPVGGAPFRDKEVFGFNPGAAVNGAYPGVDLTVATTVAWPSDALFVCAAHAQGVKVIIQPPAINLTELRSAQARSIYAATTVAAVKNAFADGVTFDYESPIEKGSVDSSTYVAVVRETTAALKAVNSGYQVTVCAAWSPDSIDGRAYDYASLAAYTDGLYVMDYDTRSQIFDVCVASANAPLAGTERGIERYLELGITPSRLILGVPWYGYRYPCLEGTVPTASLCPIKEVPFRGVNCSDAAGSEVGFDSILPKLNSSTTGRQWDTSTSSVWFNAVESTASGEKETVQYWYDDPESLALKYAVATNNGLRGTGPYTYSDAGSGEMGRRMWAALAKFRQGKP